MSDTFPPPLIWELAGWRCRLRTDTWESHTRLLALGAKEGGDDAEPLTRLDILLADGPGPRFVWTRQDGQPGDFRAVFAGPDGKRFPPLPQPGHQIYADTVLGDGPALEPCGGKLHILSPDAWPMYASHVLSWLLLRERPVAAVHAAVCAVGETALLLVGPSGCGKSTLSYALARQGADYFSDEAAYLDRRDCRLSVHAHRLGLRPGGVAALSDGPDAPAWFLSKPDDLKCAPPVPVPKVPCPARRTVLLFVQGFGSAPSLVPIEGGEAARRLAFVMGCGDPSPLARLEAAADLVSRLPCRALTLGRPEETAALLIARAAEMSCPTH